MLEPLRHNTLQGEVLAAPFHHVDMDNVVALSECAMRTRRRLQHSDVNVAKLIQMRDDPDLARHVRESDIICVDGAGVTLACRMLGVGFGGRVPGIDLMMRSLDLCAREGFRPYFLGARQEVVEGVVRRLAITHPSLRIAGYRNGYFTVAEEAEIVAGIRDSSADCLFVGITSPIKERFLSQHRDALDVPFQVGVGGAFDVLSGAVRRAPACVQAIGMEWLFRAVQEPRRLLRRYLVTNTRFAGLLLREWVGKPFREAARTTSLQRPPLS